MSFSLLGLINYFLFELCIVFDIANPAAGLPKSGHLTSNIGPLEERNSWAAFAETTRRTRRARLSSRPVLF
ncbi:MAG: hypothetical protein WCQ21_27325, partial [Verrucomicrobiota bacterium]